MTPPILWRTCSTIAQISALVSLDVSGRKAVTERVVRAFVKARPSLVFLGLLATGGSACEVLTSRENLKVHTKVVVVI